MSRHLSDEQYRALQLALVLRPEQGPLVPGSGGIRKLRWAAAGRGKRGGLRVIYYWAAAEDVCYMLYAYATRPNASGAGAEGWGSMDAACCPRSDSFHEEER